MLLCELDYNLDWKNLNEDQKAALLENWPVAKSVYRKDNDTCDLWSLRKQRLTMDEVYNIQRCGVRVEVHGIDGTMLTKMRDRGPHSGLTGVDMQDHKVVQIAVSDVGLLTLNEVEVCEDFCTHALQDMLDKGWRILAVCPPNAARRPDYILGRRKAPTE